MDRGELYADLSKRLLNLPSSITIHPAPIFGKERNQVYESAMEPSRRTQRIRRDPGCDSGTA
jgi:hypothetical protein